MEAINSTRFLMLVKYLSKIGQKLVKNGQKMIKNWSKIDPLS